MLDGCCGAYAIYCPLNRKKVLLVISRMALHVDVAFAHVASDDVEDRRSRVVGTWQAIEDDTCIATGATVVVAWASELESVQVVDFNNRLTPGGA